MGSFIVLDGELDKNHGRGVTCGGIVGHPREVHGITFIILADGGQWSAINAIQLREQLELWDRRLRRIGSGVHVHNGKQYWGKVLEASIQFTKLIRAFINC